MALNKHLNLGNSEYVFSYYIWTEPFSLHLVTSRTRGIQVFYTFELWTNLDLNSVFDTYYPVTLSKLHKLTEPTIRLPPQSTK